MFPEPGDAVAQARAKAFCQACPAVGPCLEAGLVTDREGKAAMRYGVWGEKNELQRGRIIARRAKAAKALADAAAEAGRGVAEGVPVGD